MPDRDNPVQTGQGFYNKTQETGACIFFDADGAWEVTTEADTGDTIVRIPKDARWRVATDTLKPHPNRPVPEQWQIGQKLVAIFLKNGELQAEDEGKITLLKDQTS